MQASPAEVYVTAPDKGSPDNQRPDGPKSLVPLGGILTALLVACAAVFGAIAWQNSVLQAPPVLDMSGPDLSALDLSALDLSGRVATPLDVALAEAAHKRDAVVVPTLPGAVLADSVTVPADQQASVEARQAAQPSDDPQSDEPRDSDGESAESAERSRLAVGAAHVPRAYRPAGTTQPPLPESEPGSQRQPLRRYAGQNVVLWTDTRPEYAGELLGRLDSFLQQAGAEMARVLDTPSTPKSVQIYVFESQERYQDYAREHAPGLVNNGGFYDGGLRTVVTYRYNNSMQLYFHELVHAMMGEQFGDHHFTRYTRRNWPIWFDEGISEYLGSFDLRGGQIHIPAQNKGKLAYLVNALANRVFIDLPSLLRAPSERFSGTSMNIYYAESWGLLDFLLSSPVTRPKVAQFFRRIKGGEDGIGAFKACFGDDLGALDAAWRAHIYQVSVAQPAEIPLFGGSTIDDWTIHEGGHWRAGGGEITGQGDRNYNYLIKNDLPVSDFSYTVDVQLTRGTAGLVLGNNFHGEYPYYYLIEIARDVVMVRRAWSASQIEPVIQAYAEVPPGEWTQVRATVSDRVLRLSVGGREVLQTRVDRDRYSLFGLYLYRAKVKFRNIVLHREGPPRALTTLPPVPAGGPAQPGMTAP